MLLLIFEGEVSNAMSHLKRPHGIGCQTDKKPLIRQLLTNVSSAAPQRDFIRAQVMLRET